MRLVLLLVIILSALLGPRAYAAIQPAGGDLLYEIESIRADMPGRDSEGFSPPGSADLDTWRNIAGALLEEQAGTVDSLVMAHSPDYQLLLYLDTGLDSSEYYVLKETPPITPG